MYEILKMPMKLALASIAIACASVANAAPITGEELPGSSSFDAPSTNALNYAQQVPGRIGQAAPFVLFDSNGLGEVTLIFSNVSPGEAFFEYRLDGVGRTSGAAHPVVLGDFINPGVTVGSGAPPLIRTFNATDYVEIRLALGGERDWDFDWTAFEVGAAAVPAPAMPALLAVGLLGLGYAQRRRSAE